MNIANKLTILRIILVPVYLIFFFLNITHYHYFIATFIFIIASLTDMLDGKLARKYNLITDFGKFADPLADKLLVLSAMIGFIEAGLMPAWICIIIVAREIAISGFRLVCANKGTVIAASKWGKLKTVTQMAFIIMTVINFPFYFGALIPTICNIWEIVRVVLMYIALVMTVVSLIDYFVKNRKSFSI